VSCSMGARSISERLHVLIEMVHGYHSAGCSGELQRVKLCCRVLQITVRDNMSPSRSRHTHRALARPLQRSVLQCIAEFAV